MELEHSFTVPVPKDRAWDVLLDVERVAPCMPGATLDSVDGDEIRGKIRVKVGPITQMYVGTARFVERDPVAGVVTLEASGKETRGAGTASASVRSVLEDRGNETRVTVLTTLKVTGKPAQFGRGVLNEVGGKLLTIFAANLAATLAEPAAAAASVSAPVSAPVSVPADIAADIAADGTADGAGTLPAIVAADLDAPVDDLALATRLREALRRAGITTIGELVAKSSSDLLDLSGIGQNSVETIKVKLTERGLTLGHPPEVAPAGQIEPSPAATAGQAEPAPAATTAGQIEPAPAATTAGQAEPATAATAGAQIEPGPAAQIEPAPAATTTAAQIEPGPATAGQIPAGSVPPQLTAGTVSNGTAPATTGATTTARPQPGAAKAANGEAEPINLLKIAGMPVLKRALPVLAGLTAALLIALRRKLRRRASD